MAIIADVFDVVLKDNTTGDIIASTTLTEANIEIRVDTQDVRGGKGNQLIAVLHSSRDIEISLTDVDFKYEWLVQQLGTSITTGTGVAYAMPKWYTVVDASSSKKITLDETPLATNNDLKIFKADGTAITAFTVSGKDVTITSGVSAGDLVEVRTYKYSTNANTKTVTIEQDKFPATVMMILETLEINENEVPVARVQYQFDSVLPTGNITLNTSSERSAKAFQTTFRVIKPKTSTVVGRVLRIPLS